jgi:hypothetical protein
MPINGLRFKGKLERAANHRTRLGVRLAGTTAPLAGLGIGEILKSFSCKLPPAHFLEITDHRDTAPSHPRYSGSHRKGQWGCSF